MIILCGRGSCIINISNSNHCIDPPCLYHIPDTNRHVCTDKEVDLAVSMAFVVFLHNCPYDPGILLFFRDGCSGIIRVDCKHPVVCRNSFIETSVFTKSAPIMIPYVGIIGVDRDCWFKWGDRFSYTSGLFIHHSPFKPDFSICRVNCECFLKRLNRFVVSSVIFLDDTTCLPDTRIPRLYRKSAIKTGNGIIIPV